MIELDSPPSSNLLHCDIIFRNESRVKSHERHCLSNCANPKLSWRENYKITLNDNITTPCVTIQSGDGYLSVKSSINPMKVAIQMLMFRA